MLAIPEREPSASRWATRAALFAFGMILAAAFLHRLFGMPTAVAFNLFLAAMLVAGLSIACSAVAAAIIWQTGRPGTARVLFAVCLSLALLSIPLLYTMWVRNYPHLHDITTDFENPPAFNAIARLRGPGDNPVAYDRVNEADEQARAYPDIKPMQIARSSDEAFALVVDAMKRLKLEIVREDAPDPEAGTPGEIEAVDRSLIMGSYQDAVIRVAGGEESARVDIRLASRFGRADMGYNAERVRELAKEIQARVDATMPTAADEAKRAKPEKAGGPKSENRRKSRARAQ
ncbi:DUF1499 domain-containing protein [uncultured Hyphomicrobium sp.]|uniref:DUF1499 domain-containing protein n=1 Tax=uncultured Hyphomicrobium sp. TaxID=194373 RepID=UPI0025FB960C|nr:DUF1499 domain-containing protein [uncultured Hyphomicrobium sp.]